jgi:hypothetical protein
MGWTREGISDITGNEKEKNKSYECNETAAWKKKNHAAIRKSFESNAHRSSQKKSNIYAISAPADIPSD